MNISADIIYASIWDASHWDASNWNASHSHAENWPRPIGTRLIGTTPIQLSMLIAFFDKALLTMLHWSWLVVQLHTYCIKFTFCFTFLLHNLTLMTLWKSISITAISQNYNCDSCVTLSAKVCQHCAQNMSQFYTGLSLFWLVPHSDVSQILTHRHFYCINLRNSYSHLFMFWEHSIKLSSGVYVLTV